MSEIQFDPDESDAAVQRFIDSYLRSDGIFVIRMLTLHSGRPLPNIYSILHLGVIFGTDLVQELWKSYFGIEERIHRSSSYPKIGFPMAVEDQTDFENSKNALRQRKRNQEEEEKKATEARERLITPPPPPTSVLRALQKAITSSPSKVHSNAYASGNSASSPGTRPVSAMEPSEGYSGPPPVHPQFSIGDQRIPHVDSEHSLPSKLLEVPEEDEQNDVNVSRAHDFRNRQPAADGKLIMRV
jgi:hypothetical protein